METLRKHNKLIIFGSILVIIGCFLALAYPFYYQHSCETRVYHDLQEPVSKAMPAAIGIVRVSHEGESSSYSAGASGVIISAKDGEYKALTACHVVADESSEYRVFTVSTESRDQYRDRVYGDDRHVTNDEYYGAMAEAKVIKKDPDCDLALISFESREALGSVDVSEKDPAKGERIAVIGNPSGEKFRVSYGVIKTGKEEKFDPGDGIVNDVLRHNAYEAPGSSGSAALNEDMELAGINIGGGRNAFGCFKYGVMIPASQVREFLADSRN